MPAFIPLMNATERPSANSRRFAALGSRDLHRVPDFEVRDSQPARHLENFFPGLVDLLAPRSSCKQKRFPNGDSPESYQPTNEGDAAMRFLSMIRIDENTGQKPSERLMTEMGKLIDEMTKEGTLVRTAGLRPTKEGFRVRSRHGKLSTTDGPFTESKEVIGGYAVLEAKSKEHAIELTKRFLAVHGDEWDLECEVRPLDGPEFGA